MINPRNSFLLLLIVIAYTISAHAEQIGRDEIFATTTLHEMRVAYPDLDKYSTEQLQTLLSAKAALQDFYEGINADAPTAKAMSETTAAKYLDSIMKTRSGGGVVSGFRLLDATFDSNKRIIFRIDLTVSHAGTSCTYQGALGMATVDQKWKIYDLERGEIVQNDKAANNETAQLNRSAANSDLINKLDAPTIIRTVSTDATVDSNYYSTMQRDEIISAKKTLMSFLKSADEGDENYAEFLTGNAREQFSHGGRLLDDEERILSAKILEVKSAKGRNEVSFSYRLMLEDEGTICEYQDWVVLQKADHNWLISNLSDLRNAGTVVP